MGTLNRRGGARAGLVVAALTLLVCLTAPGYLAAQPAGGWQLTGLTGDVQRLHGPKSGAFFAWTGADLVRSEDGGATWTAIQLPPGAYRAQPDPTDHGTVYAAAPDGLYRATGLYRSGDGAATWERIRDLSPKRPATGEYRVIALEVSPADPATVYLFAAVNWGADFVSERSRDRGQSWEIVDRPGPTSLCGWSMPILQAHPTDPNRLFRSFGCIAGRNTAMSLNESRDAGATWHQIYYDGRAYTWPDRLAFTASPGRLYLATHRDHRIGGSVLLRSDDDGASWQTALEFPKSTENAKRTSDDTTIGAVVADPANPDRLWLALNTRPPGDAALPSGAVRVSADGGATWAPVGAELPEIADLIVGSDGRNLYAATTDGLYRFALP